MAPNGYTERTCTAIGPHEGGMCIWQHRTHQDHQVSRSHLDQFGTITGHNANPARPEIGPTWQPGKTANPGTQPSQPWGTLGNPPGRSTWGTPLVTAPILGRLKSGHSLTNGPYAANWAEPKVGPTGQPCKTANRTSQRRCNWVMD